MGDLLFKEIRDELKFRLGDRTDLETSGQLSTWVKLAYIDIAYWFRHPELEKTTTFNTVAAQRIYTLANMTATDLRSIIGLRNNTSPRRISRSDVLRQDSINESTGAAVVRYARWGDTVELDPTPNNVQSIRLRYRRQVVAITDFTASPGQKSELRHEMDNFIIARSVWLGRAAMGETDRAVTAKAEYKELVANYDWPISEEEEQSDDYPIGPPPYLR